MESDLNKNNAVKDKTLTKKINETNTKTESNVGNTDELNNLIKNSESNIIKL